MNETVKDVIVKGTAVGRFLVHWGYIPLILYIGYRNSSPKPPLARIFSPMA
ncbi:translocase of the outer mitochondrial membrane [Coemansia helicoidea]|uniref:Translocase of the outer mitochondrial membrane n=1 Tax=Coemansia helicoidea TaxID=1286919 RepID=A0ACC1KSL1_9FUNG|nr:translocase of the outer mitochondrial membrane [Coemansia helicoidea]